ncbi:MAG: hypothetical protein E3J72_10270 [Planctomycetota bacterium]|nr:MAG: hypothetical protein E3J72_10270 [Planctomycetota bacterium]
MLRISVLLILVLVAFGCNGIGPIANGPNGETTNGAQTRAVEIALPSLPLPLVEVPVPAAAAGTYRNIEQLSIAKDVLDIHADVHPGGDQLVFTRIRKERNPCIFVKPLHGLAARILTRPNSSSAWPRFSPDGKRIAFASNINGNWDIFIIPLQTPHALEQVTMSAANEIAPSWSPDGRNLIYCALINGIWEMKIVNLTSMNTTWIGPGLFPDWSPDGSKIAYQYVTPGTPPKYSIWTRDIDYNSQTHTARPTGSPTRIVAGQEFSACYPSWSPDATKIAFSAVPGGWTKMMSATALVGRDIWTVKADGTQMCILTASDAHSWDPVWTEDNTGRARIIFTSARDGTYNIWSVEPGAE